MAHRDASHNGGTQKGSQGIQGTRCPFLHFHIYYLYNNLVDTMMRQEGLSCRVEFSFSMCQHVIHSTNHTTNHTMAGDGHQVLPHHHSSATTTTLENEPSRYHPLAGNANGGFFITHIPSAYHHPLPSLETRMEGSFSSPDTHTHSHSSLSRNPRAFPRDPTPFCKPKGLCPPPPPCRILVYIFVLN
jgi:hypothetical protein